VAEYLDEAIGCRALFATHYHELTSLCESSRQVANYSVSAREMDGDVVFLHRVVAGAASRSYGVAVAKLAGLPESVLARARAILERLEAGGAPLGRTTGARAGRDQLELFAARPGESRAESEVLGTLRGLEVERLTPLDALSLLARLKQKL
jgi:DNA mismatch repair protein MutS